jgi:hypothetical protein
MKRLIQPEILDSLPPDDPRALRSRRDLHRVNSWMRNHSIMIGALKNHLDGPAPEQITEIGAGDGRFLLRVAEKVSPRWPGVKAILIDRQKVVAPQTTAAFAKLGWRAEAVVADVFDWPQTGAPDEVVIANLFLHHFDQARLAGLLRVISGRAKVFVAVEPRRFCSGFPGSQLLRLIGCSAVTRHDAAASIRAGFLAAEISALWPGKKNWQLTERRAGLFSHLFIARRTG